MKVQRIVLTCLLLAVFAFLPGCKSTSPPPPPMPQLTPMPGSGASALEMERYQLEEEKRSLSEKYSDHVDRIQQINSRLIQINIELQRQANPHY